MREGPSFDAMRILPAVPDHLIGDAATLYLEAFGAKLGPILGRDVRAQRFLAAVLRPAHGLAAVDGRGDLLGIAGVHNERTGFVGGDFSDLARAYGWFGATWRAAALTLFERAPDPGDLLMDGIVVAPGARGRGVGRALLAAVIETARREGAARVRLDVVDTNPRARALYQRLGFVAVKHQHHGVLMRPFGFAASTTMVLELT